MDRRPVYTAGGGGGGGGPHSRRTRRPRSPVGGGGGGTARPAPAAVAASAARDRRDQARRDQSSTPAPVTDRTTVTCARADDAARAGPVRSPAQSGPAPGQGTPRDVPRTSSASSGSPVLPASPHSPHEPTRETTARPAAMGERGDAQAGGMPPLQALWPKRARVRPGAVMPRPGGRGPDRRLADRSSERRPAGRVQLIGRGPARGALQPAGLPRGEQARDRLTTDPPSHATPAQGQQAEVGEAVPLLPPGSSGRAHALHRSVRPQGREAVAFQVASRLAGSVRPDVRARREATVREKRRGGEERAWLGFVPG